MAQWRGLGRWYFLVVLAPPESAVPPDAPFSGSGLDVTDCGTLATVSLQWREDFRSDAAARRARWRGAYQFRRCSRLLTPLTPPVF
jgi:hypothetical protein